MEKKIKVGDRILIKATKKIPEHFATVTKVKKTRFDCELDVPRAPTSKYAWGYPNEGKRYIGYTMRIESNEYEVMPEF